MKRISALILALLLLLTAVSCAKSGQEDTATTTTTQSTTTTAVTEPVEPGILDDLGEKSFNNQTFTILDANDYPDMHINMPGKEMTGENIPDAVYQRDLIIEETYGCDVTYIQMTNADVGITALSNAHRAGDKVYDLCISTVSGGRLSTLATQGILANLCDIPYLSLEANWWSRLIYENCRLGNKMYFTTGDIAPAVYDAPSCVMLNKKLLSEYQIDTDFYTMVKEGRWTVDELTRITKDTDADLNQDGQLHTEHDFFGIIYQEKTLTASSMVVGCGLSLGTVEGETINIDLNNETTARVTEKLRLMVTDNITHGGQYDMINKTFKGDRAIALIHLMETPKHKLRDMPSDYLILPMPKFDVEQESYRSLVNGWCDCFVGIPNNADLEFVGFVAEALARQSYETVRPETYDLVFKLKSVRDEGSSDMIDIIFNTLYIDFCQIYNFGEMSTAISGIMFENKPFASTLNALKNVTKKTVERFVDSWLAIQ